MSKTRDPIGSKNVELDTAIDLLKRAVKYTGNIDQKHIDLTLIPVSELGMYKTALMVAQKAIKDGKLGRDEFLRRVDLDT